MSDPEVAAEFLSQVVLKYGFVQASRLFELANGPETAPLVWSMAIAAISSTSEGQVIDNVLHNPHNCHLMGVYPDAPSTEPSFVYSIGLWYNFQHPEIICLGLSPQVGGLLINSYAARVAAGEVVPVGEAISGELADDYLLQFRQCGEIAQRDYTCWASWFNGTRQYPVLQLIWQDKAHRWPWEPGFHPAAAQPLLLP